MSAASPVVDSAPGVGAERDDGLQWGEWMAATQHGDHAAYRTLLGAITPYLRAIARRHLGHEADAEDAVQDILIIVNDIRHTFEPGRPFKPWLRTIATRRCIDLLRGRTRRLKNEITSDADFESHVASDDTPEEALARQQEKHRLHGTVDLLPLRQRDAIRLLHLKELSLREAAEQSELSVGSLKVACHRALKALERKLSGNE